MSKNPLDLAREFVGLVDGLNSVPGMMTSHDLGKEAIARELLRLHAENERLRAAVKAAVAEILSDPIEDDGA